jgi:hypothetical protein
MEEKNYHPPAEESFPQPEEPDPVPLVPELVDPLVVELPVVEAGVWLVVDVAAGVEPVELDELELLTVPEVEELPVEPDDVVVAGVLLLSKDDELVVPELEDGVVEKELSVVVLVDPKPEEGCDWYDDVEPPVL